MTDQGFPIIDYRHDQSARERGAMQGEQFRQGIRELADIRLNLMQQRNQTLTLDHIHRLAAEQWALTVKMDSELTEELEGICAGAGISREQAVVLNNYTDFRDIEMPDEGCSAVFVNREPGPIQGQTWDMHASAKNYVCCIRIPGNEMHSETLVFSLVGCVGMMGYTAAGTAVGVTNLNTNGAVAGVLWPVIVRMALRLASVPEMVSLLNSAKVTSGHSYLMSSTRQSELWDILPGLRRRIGAVDRHEDGHLFHTNHCLCPEGIPREQPKAVNTTTYIRYELLKKKINDISTFDDLYALLNDHENYPKSICSNFRANLKDPSVTCGGAVGDLENGRVTMWRGDELYDDNFVRHEFLLAKQAECR